MNLILYLIAVAFLSMGFVGLLSPVSVGRLFDVSYESVNARNEVRAVYGGFGVAMALALILASQCEPWREGIVLCVAVALSGMALGRLWSVIFEFPGFWPWFFFSVETVGAALLFWEIIQ